MCLLGECSVLQVGTEPVGPLPFAVAVFQLVLVGWDGTGDALREIVLIGRYHLALGYEAPKRPLCLEVVLTRFFNRERGGGRLLVLLFGHGRLSGWSRSSSRVPGIASRVPIRVGCPSGVSWPCAGRGSPGHEGRLWLSALSAPRLSLAVVSVRAESRQYERIRPHFPLYIICYFEWVGGRVEPAHGPRLWRSLVSAPVLKVPVRSCPVHEIPALGCRAVSRRVPL